MTIPSQTTFILALLAGPLLLAPAVSAAAEGNWVSPFNNDPTPSPVQELLRLPYGEHARRVRGWGM